MARKKEEGGFGETVKVIVQALLIALVVRTLLFQPFNIPSGSLIPTLLIGDYLFVSKYSYGYSKHSLPVQPAAVFNGRIMASDPKRGDIAVFKLPRDGSTDYIKRVIGLPGDTVQMIEGRAVHQRPGRSKRERVGERAHARRLRPRDRGADLSRDAARRQHARDHRARRRPRLLRQHDRVQGAARPLLHDGRQSRQLARTRASPSQDGGVGSVPFENFVGRAEIIFFSVEEGEPAWQFWKWPWTVRWSRLFSPVR